MAPEDKRHVGAKAQREAVNQLIDHHKEEYDKILGDLRVEMGLPREAGPAKKPSKVELLRAQLREKGIEPTV